VRKKEHFNKRVAQARGPDWVEKLSQGKIDSKMNPSFLCNARVQAGLRQADIAKKVNVSLSSYCAIERGHRKVKEITALVIASVLNKKMHSLFDPCPDDTQYSKFVASLMKPHSKERKPNAKPDAEKIA
jgi:DNA-binding XRE family transcriptional regulator